MSLQCFPTSILPPDDPLKAKPATPPPGSIVGDALFPVGGSTHPKQAPRLRGEFERQLTHPFGRDTATTLSEEN